jgi:hypothetical protein
MRRGPGPPPRPKEEEHPPSPWKTIRLIPLFIRDLERVRSRIAEYELQMQQVEEEDQVEDIMALTAPPVSATKVVVPNVIPVSSAIGKGNPRWLPRGRGNTTEPSPDITCGCQGTAATCTTCAGLCGDWGPHWSGSRAQWARGASVTTTCSIFGNGQSGPQRKAEIA